MEVPSHAQIPVQGSWNYSASSILGMRFFFIIIISIFSNQIVENTRLHISLLPYKSSLEKTATYLLEHSLPNFF